MIARRGLTLVEVLASLALLSAIAAAALAVVQSSSRTAATTTKHIAWDHAADAVIASIAADLAAGDFDPIGDRARADPRVRIQDDGGRRALSIRTRGPAGDVRVRIYVASDDRLLITTAGPEGRSVRDSIGDSPAAALADIVSFAPLLDSDGQALYVTIAGPGRARRIAVFVLEAEASP